MVVWSLVGTPGRELLANHAQGQKLVALQAQDGPQAVHVRLRVEPVAALRAPRREKLLILQVADLRDGDVRELAAEQLADGADREGLAVPRRRVGTRSRLNGGLALSE